VLSQGAAGRDPRRAAARPPPQGESPSRPCWQISTRLFCRASPTGSRPTSSPTSRPTPRSRPSSGEMLSAGLGVQGMLWATSPACTELETHVLDWMADMLGLPERFKSNSAGGGVIQDTRPARADRAAGSARAGDKLRDERAGLRRAPGRVHLDADALVRGEGGQDRGYWPGEPAGIDVDESLPCGPTCWRPRSGPIEPRACIPFFVTATIGTTSSNALDPAAGNRTICREEGIWLHVDGAMAGTAALCPEFRYVAGWVGVCRQLLLQSPQVDVHELRLRLLLRGRPSGPDQARCPCCPSICATKRRNRAR
jgi:hypothetical protein